MALIRPLILFLALLLWLPLSGLPQSVSETYRVDREHPRLLLTARRLRLLRRERERQSVRWMQFDALITRKAPMPEKGFAYALYYIVSGSEPFGREAIQWALGPGADLRQLALVFDWCQPLLTKDQSAALAAKLKQRISAAASAADVSSIRSRVLAAVTLSGHVPGVTDRQLQFVINDWWRGRIIPALKLGKPVLPHSETYALLEMLHTIRDNFDIDLRREDPAYFTELPIYHLLSSYPAVYPAAENDYRIPVMKKPGEPDLREAVLSRAAEFSMVAYDTNALETQFLQGWLIQDQFLMRSPLGIPYEFLWANPYQPGLSYYNAPLVLHDKRSGLLVMRSSWDGDAKWFYYCPGLVQMFANGTIKNLDLGTLGDPVPIGNSVMLPAAKLSKFTVDRKEAVTYYLIGLKPGQKYEIEVDDEELREEKADAGGILVLSFPANRNAGVRWKPLDIDRKVH